MEQLTKKDIKNIRKNSIGEANYILQIPKKVKVVLERHVPKANLKEIHSDTKTAIELCLMFIDLMSIQCILQYKGEWTASTLSKTTLFNKFRTEDNLYAYSKIKRVLLEGSKKKGSIIEIYSEPIEGVQSTKYKISDTYLNAGTENYELQTQFAKELHQRERNKLLKRANENPIANNILEYEYSLEWPADNEVYNFLKFAAKEGYTNTKGKLLKTLNKKSKGSKGYEQEKYIFVEDYLQIYKYFTDYNLMIPQILNGKGGGRVMSSFNMMPAIIRDELILPMNGLVLGENLWEYDYSALHPNIAMAYYESELVVSHDETAKYLNIDRKDAKLHNLKFFNKPIEQMRTSPLWEYYKNNMGERSFNQMIEDKRLKPDFLTRYIFTRETEIMTEWFYKCKDAGINVFYVYDAFYVTDKRAEVLMPTIK